MTHRDTFVTRSSFEGGWEGHFQWVIRETSSFRCSLLDDHDCFFLINILFGDKMKCSKMMLQMKRTPRVSPCMWSLISGRLLA